MLPMVYYLSDRQLTTAICMSLNKQMSDVVPISAFVLLR